MAKIGKKYRFLTYNFPTILPTGLLFCSKVATINAHLRIKFCEADFLRILGPKNVFLVQKIAKFGKKYRFLAYNFRTNLPIGL